MVGFKLKRPWLIRQNEVKNMILNERGGTKYPRTGGMGESTPFAKQSRKKEREDGHDRWPLFFYLHHNLFVILLFSLNNFCPCQDLNPGHPRY